MLSTRLLRNSFIAALVALAGITAVEAAPVTLKVVSARTEPNFPGGAVQEGALVTAYKYIINVDNTGTTEQRSPNPGAGCNPADPGYPKTCHWTSIAGAATSSPVYTQGDQTDFASGLNVADGRYLISVLADGYKLDGRHFTVAGNTVTWEGKAANDPASEVKVELQPTPLPDAQIQAEVFEDVSPVNSAPDVPAEAGLAGFQGHILDTLGEVTTNVYGDPLCSKYDTTGTLIAGSGGRCLSACYVVDGGVDVGTVDPVDAAGRCPLSPTRANGTRLTMTLPDGTTTLAPAGAAIEGKVKIPNLGPNRYTLSVTPPDGSGWIQTTTLEGNHDWDAWVMEGATGLDTEFIVAGEPFPAIIFGYVPVPGTPSAVGSALPASLGGTGTIKGVVDAVKIYVPTTGGVPGLPGEIWGGLQGAKIDKPIEYPWVTLTDLDNGDTIVWAGQGKVDGTFEIPNVPAGTYTVTWWDEPQNQILDLVNVTIAAGETVDMGVLPLSGWWTYLDGYVYNDINRNGVKDPGEPGLPNYTLTMRRRENTLMDRGSTAVTTDANGYYKFEAGYPMTQWLVMEAYDDLHYTTGVTYQADNQPSPTTILGAGVDVSVHPIIGLSGRMDWGKHNYDPLGRNGIDPRNGGIVGTVSYDTTRNELDPRYAAVETWQPSIPNLVVKLFSPVACGTTSGAVCDSTGRYETAADGSLAKGPLLNTYLTETWQRPSGCIARGLDGTPLVHGVDEQVLPEELDPQNPTKECLEAPLMGVQFGTYATGQGTADANFGATVDGNYGFGDGCFVSTSSPVVPGQFDENSGTCVSGTVQPLPAGNYLVQVDLNSQLDTQGRPVYKVTREEDINIGNGDQFVPAVPPPACAGALHTVDSTGNANFPGGPGTSPYEGMSRPLCDTKLVTLSNGKSIAPSFNLFTDVPVPGRHWFIVIDDLNFSSNPKSITYGEKAGMPFVPVGIYDYTDRLIKTVESDYNGLADVLLPSTNRINCPTPSGVCTNLYRYVGNDPGIPGRLNLNFNPSFRTIAAEFEVMPGSIIPADLAPTQVGVSVQLPGGQNTSPVQCRLDDITPELYAVDRPFVRPVSGQGEAASPAFTISGKGFGSAPGSILLDGVPMTSGVTWGANQISVSVPATTVPGAKQLIIAAANGQRTVNGLTLHVLGAGYNPQRFEVGPGRTYAPAETLPATANHAIQLALDAAARYVSADDGRSALVVVYPNNPSVNPRQNPRGAYYENLIINARVKLQGVGPGSPDGSVRGSIIDGSAFAGDSPVATDWATAINSISWAGNQTIYDGAVISVYVPAPTGGNARSRLRAFPIAANANSAPSIDGFDLRGGDQQGFPGNINPIGGGPTGQPGGLITQGGAVFANAYARNLRISNNVVQNNGGAYGTIRIGTPDLPAPDVSNHNEDIVIANNRVIQNAGTNLAGGIGLFNGADRYQVSNNDICGNFSAEYGGGVSALGYSPSGRINNNRIYFNRSNDEGGGIMIAGSLPAVATQLSPGSGPVDISGNLIQANLANDDGGGLRFLMAGNFPMNVYNNFIVNNISTHEGGGIGINDAPDVRVFNNTIMKNLTTATAITSNGNPAPAGLSTSVNSDLLQATLPANALRFSKPLLFNNIFWDNRAGTRTNANVAGLGNLTDCTTAPCDYWDLGVADADTLPGAVLSPTNSIVQQTAAVHPYEGSATNIALDPFVAATYDVGVTFNTWRNNPAFLGAIMISADLPPNLLGNYHLSSDQSVAYNAGAAAAGGISAPTNDIDSNLRPAFGAFDIGGDELPGATADLRITKTDGVTTVARGQQVTYTITVTNAGPDTVNGALVNDIVPTGLTNVTWTCAPATSVCGSQSGTGNIAGASVTLGNGDSAVFTLTGTVAANAPNTLTNTATVAAPSGTTDPITGNNSSTDTDQVRTPADLAISVTDNQTTVNRGAPVRYVITVSNLGPNAVTGATVNDNFPGNAAGLNGNISWTCATNGVVGTTCGGGANGNGTINRTVNMPVGSTITFTTTSGSVSTTTNVATLSNTATVSVPAGTYVDTNPANNSSTDVDTINGFHVGALIGSGANSTTNANQWAASATITVHDSNHAPVTGVTVAGSWLSFGGGSGGGSCTTDATGKCTVTRTAISRAFGLTATFTVTNLTKTPNGYQPSLNEGGLILGGVVTVSRP